MSDYWEEDEEFEETVDQTKPHRTARRRRTAEETRGNLYLLTGLIIGIGLGLLIAWVISPVQYLDIDPGALSPAYKDEYRRMIAMAYNTGRNLDRARERAQLVDGGSAVQQLADQAQRMLAENQPPQDARALAVLAADLARPEEKVLAPSLEASLGTAAAGSPDSEAALATSTFTQAGGISAAVQTPTRPIPTPTPTVTRTPIPTFTPRPSATPAGVLEAPFVLSERSEVCDQSLPAGLLQIQVEDKDGNPIPGIEVKVTWQESESVFYTGLAPEVNPGYADFRMLPGIIYNVKIGEVSELVSDVTIPACSGGLKLEFEEGK